MSSAPMAPAGWYADPWRLAQWRWWDGAVWTGYTDHWYGSTAPVGDVRPEPVDDSRPIRAGWIALVGAMIGVGLSILVYVVRVPLGIGRGNPLVALVAQFGLWLGLLGACVVAVRRHGTGSLKDLGLHVRWVDLALGVAFGIAALMGVTRIAVVLKAIGIEPHRASIVDPLRRGPLTVVVIIFMAVVGAPLVEELFFRGLLMSGLVSRWGAVLGILGQAILFGLVHMGPTDASGNLGVFLLIAPLGAMLGFLRYAFKRLGPGMFTHAIYNAVIVTVALAR